MALLLSALVNGAIGAPREQRIAPTVADYLTLHRLYAKFAVRPFLTAMLNHRIAERAFELAGPLSNPRTAGADIAGYLKLAAACKSSRMWEFALRYAKTWQYFVAPWRMNEKEVAAVGEDAYAVLLALEALKNAAGESGYTDLRVSYSGKLCAEAELTPGGRPGVTRTREPETVFYLDDLAVSLRTCTLKLTPGWG